MRTCEDGMTGPALGTGGGGTLGAPVTGSGADVGTDGAATGARLATSAAHASVAPPMALIQSSWPNPTDAGSMSGYQTCICASCLPNRPWSQPADSAVLLSVIASLRATLSSTSSTITLASFQPSAFIACMVPLPAMTMLLDFCTSNACT